MSRALIETLLKQDDILPDLDISSDDVHNQHDIKERPRSDGPFIVIRWEESTNFAQSYTGMNNGLSRAPRIMTLWVHNAMENGTDFEALDEILDRIDDIFDAIENQAGSDGFTVTMIRKSGRSGDLKDEGFNTIVRNAGYAVLYRRT